jgi:hypothetical protein
LEDKLLDKARDPPITINIFGNGTSNLTKINGDYPNVVVNIFKGNMTDANKTKIG